MHVDWRRLVYLLPVILPVMCAAFGIILVTLLLLGLFKTILIWPLGIAAATVAGYIVYREFPVGKVTNIALFSSVFVLIFTTLWMGFNFYFSSQHVYTNRDPGVYAAGGVWLISHDKIQVPRTYVFTDKVDVASEASAGFGVSRVNEKELYTQGSHLLPAFLGVAGRIGGANLLYKTSPLLAGFALLALFGCARLLTKDKWAIVATIILALSLPAIYFSRDSYSEMLAATFTFSSLTLFIVAINTKRLSMWCLAGLITGATALTRIDAFLSMAGIILALFAYLIVVDKKNRRTAIIESLVFTGSAVITSIIGLLDLALLSSGYLYDLSHNVRLELLGIGILFVVGVAAVAVAWNTNLVSRLHKATKSWRAKWMAGVAVFICALLASRPLWMVDRDIKGNESIKGFIEATQAVAGIPIDGYRTYAEQTVTWLVWYVGPAIVLTAVIGLAIVAYRSMKSKDIRWLAALSVVFGAAVIYLNHPAITPDQIWASRRLLPVILPGVAIFGVMGLAWIEERKKLPFGMEGKIIAACLATLAVIGPLFVSYPFLRVRTHVSELDQIEAVCAALPKHSAVVWVGNTARVSIQPTRGFCDTPAGGLYDGVTGKEQLATIAKTLEQKGYQPIIGSFETDLDLFKAVDTSKMKTISSVTTQEYNSAFTKPPRYPVSSTVTVKMGKIGTDGNISALNN